MTAEDSAGESVHGTVACPCGNKFTLSFPKETPSPAYFKTWCVECGVILEGHVEVSPAPDMNASPDIPTKTGRVVYVPIDKVRTKKP
jgi:hypothetical protein